MLLYFAYGSNMLPDQMARRCPGARGHGRAVLANWKYITTKRGTANIRPSAGSVVHGVLWRCMPGHISSLDKYEGVRWRNYHRRTVRISTPDDRLLTAITYISHRTAHGVARSDYMLGAVLPGARAFDLPESYIEELCKWLPRRTFGAGRRYYGRKA